MTPREVDEITTWELAACVEGWNRAHGAEEKPAPMSNDEFDAMLARHGL